MEERTGYRADGRADQLVLIFTIVLVPVMFVVVDTLKDRWGSKKKSAEPRPAEPRATEKTESVASREVAVAH